MAKVTTAITDSQSGITQFPNGEIIPRPVLNTPSSPGVWNASGAALTNVPPKKKFVLLDQDGKTVAALIDETLAKAWVSDHKKGAARYIEAFFAPAV